MGQSTPASRSTRSDKALTRQALTLRDQNQIPSVGVRTLRLVEAIERRAAWVAISVAITLAVNGSGGLAYGFGGIGTWVLVFYVGSLLCLAAAGVLLVGALTPDSVRSFSLDDRSLFVFFALALLVLAMIVIVGLFTHAAIEAHQHPQG